MRGEQRSVWDGRYQDTVAAMHTRVTFPPGVDVLPQGDNMAKRLVGVLEALQEVGQDDAWPDGLAETAEDLASARVMSHPVSTCSTIPCKLAQG